MGFPPLHALYPDQLLGQILMASTNPLSLADLKAGDRVEIEGQLQADGSCSRC
jgi:Protein of unknown function (DUF3300)